MQNRDIYLMILGMTLVTYLPRVLPTFLMGRIRLSARVEHFLQLIPYTAMRRRWCFPVCLAWMPTRCWGLWGLPWQVVWHGKSVPSLCVCWPPLRWKP